MLSMTGCGLLNGRLTTASVPRLCPAKFLLPAGKGLHGNFRIVANILHKHLLIYTSLQSQSISVCWSIAYQSKLYLNMTTIMAEELSSKE